MRFCITQRGSRNWPADRSLTFQCGVSLPLWRITRVKQFDPTFSTYEAAAAYRRRVIRK
jgi:hypothetical protein